MTYKAKIGIYDDAGKPVRTVEAPFWNAYNDGVLTICLDGAELQRFFKGKIPAYAALEIDLKLNEVRESVHA